MQPRADYKKLTFVLESAKAARFALMHTPASRRKSALTTGTGTGAMKEGSSARVRVGRFAL